LPTPSKTPYRTPAQRATNDVAPQERRFAEEYCVDLNVGAAAERAGLTPHQGRGLMRTERVQYAIQREFARRSSMTQVTSAEVLRRWALMMRADVNEIVKVRRAPCRYCRGHDHRYQFTAEELRQERQSHLEGQLKLDEALRVPFDDHGGDGYDKRLEPDPDCPECFGEGIPWVIFADTTRLSDGARYLYQGVEVNATGGFKLNLRRQAEAEEMVARHLGMLVERKMVLVGDVSRMSEAEIRAAMNDELRERLRLLEYTAEGGVVIDVEAGERAGASEAGPEAGEPLGEVPG
jgi:phage terminase small subunit